MEPPSWLQIIQLPAGLCFVIMQTGKSLPSTYKLLHFTLGLHSSPRSRPVLLNLKWGSIAHSLSLSSPHHPDITWSPGFSVGQVLAYWSSGQSLIPAGSEIFSTVNRVPLRTAFHYQPSITLITVQKDIKSQVIHPSSHPSIVRVYTGSLSRFRERKLELI